MNDIQRVLVTGSAGYIGSVMAPMLAAAGYEVVGLDCLYFDGCDFGTYTQAIKTIIKDIRDVRIEDVGGFDAVIHLAALCNDPLGDFNPELTMEINYRASVRLAQLCKEAGVKRFLYSSSCSMYGASDDAILNEEARLRPLTAYAKSKVSTEEDVSKLADGGFTPVLMRNATAYGASPRLRADVVLNNLSCWAFTTGRVRIMSDGTPWRPIVHVKDICQAFLEVLRAPVEAVHNQAFNVGRNSENYQVRDIAEIVREGFPNCTVEYADKATVDSRNYRVDFSKITRALPNFKPRWTARLGTDELRRAFSKIGLQGDEFQGWRFTRLANFNRLLQAGRLDDSLRWRSRS